MRILLCVHHYLDENQGAPGATLALGEALTVLGCQVEYFGFDQAFARTDGGVRHAIGFPWKLAMYLVKNSDRFDVIDVTTGDNWVWALIRKISKKKPQLLVTRSHGLEHIVVENVRRDAKSGLVKLSWKYPIYHGGFRLWEVATSLRRADLALMLNQHDRDYVINKLHILPRKVRLVENGIPAVFLNLSTNEAGLNPNDPLHIVQIGSYISRKGIEYSCQALSNLLARYKNMRVSFLGTRCPREQVLNDFAPSVRAQISVVPSYIRTELIELTKDAQITLFPSLSEGFSLALPEAMACGLAAVATAIPGNIEIARDGVNALLIPPRDSRAIEQALERLNDDRALLRNLRVGAHKTAQHYGWDGIAAKTLALYNEALAINSAAEFKSS